MQWLFIKVYNNPSKSVIIRLYACTLLKISYNIFSEIIFLDYYFYSLYLYIFIIVENRLFQKLFQKF